MRRTVLLAVAASSYVLAACASGGATTGARTAEAGTTPHSHAEVAHEHVHMPGPDATAGPGFTAADVRFMQDMIGHHAQALVMARKAPTHGASEMILKLAEKIDISQRDEIAFMKEWLADRTQPIPDDAHLHTMHMPGMLTQEQLAQLDAARSREFDRLFLTLMIQHHEGALQMVETLFASPGAAQDSDIFRFATDVATDQTDEIDVMKHMLGMLAANRGSGL